MTTSRPAIVSQSIDFEGLTIRRSAVFMSDTSLSCLSRLRRAFIAFLNLMVRGSSPGNLTATVATFRTICVAASAAGAAKHASSKLPLISVIFRRNIAPLPHRLSFARRRLLSRAGGDQLVDLAAVHVDDLERPAVVAELLAGVRQVLEDRQGKARDGRIIPLLRKVHAKPVGKHVGARRARHQPA